MRDNKIDNFIKTRNLVLTALLFVISIVLATVENTLPSFAVPGVKLGLSNIVVMYALFFVNKNQAFTIAVLKALFVLSTRGVVAGSLSFCGGILSLAVMLLIIYTFKGTASYLIISIFGAVFHNLGQFIAISFIYTYMNIWAYLPILLISGVITGIVTATLLRFILPALNKHGLK